ncbi:MAG TPA: putative sulfate exporter family transporter [Nitrospirae bacterium]|nr:putative sulfate exporter family transporter [Nitrospirota bacterium]
MLRKLSGLAISLVIAVIAFILSYVHPSFEALAISIILGMLFSNILEERRFLDEGIKLTIKVFLPVGIALYGTQLSVRALDPAMTPLVFLTFIAVFTLVYLIAKWFGLRNNIRILLATGISICGASAIAIVSPLINSDGEETSISLIVVMIYGLFGMIAYPLFANLLGLGIKEFAFVSGTTLPMIGQIKVAASTYGAECVETALKYKLLRMSFLVFLVTLTVFLSRKEGRRIYVPWFIAVFVILAVAVNLLKMDRLSEMSAPVSRFALSTALAAIGLSVDFESITEEGIKPLLIVALSIAVILSVQFLLFQIVM